MATVRLCNIALCSALLILLGFAVFSSQSASSYTSTERGNATDPAGLHFQEFCVKAGEIWSGFQVDFFQYSPGNGPICLCMHCKLTTPDCLHYDDATPQINSLCSGGSVWLSTRVHPACVHASTCVCIWLQCIARKRKRKLKYSQNSTTYYANSCATFNIILSGDIEPNPGPEQSGLNPTGDTRNGSCSNHSSYVANLNIYSQNLRSIKNKLDTYHSTFTAHLNPFGVFNFFALTETWLNADVSDSEIQCNYHQLHDISQRQK